MARSEITSDQRAMAVALLANALRKDAHVRARTGDGRPHDLAGIGGRSRSEASQQYIRGMRDLLTVLFENGRAVADACYDDARVQAFGPAARVTPEEDR
jgi:hypothetical protein